MRAELVSEADAKLRKAQEAEQRAQSTMAQAEARFGTERLRHSVLAWQQLASTHDIPEFFANPGHSAFFWKSWEFFQEDGKAELWVSNEDMKNNREQFMAYAARNLHLHTCGWCEKPEVANIGQRVQFVYALADHLEIREEVEEAGLVETNQHLAWHRERTVAAAITEERRRALSGTGRQPIGGNEEPSTGLPLSQHPKECCCPNCNGIPRHLRTGEVVENF
ncbi:hypothetical protein SBA7_880009 [Candidatus Sulfotelmatobacter sp. SbA7]|nr:hypothetical protein SBA7_880009 [Candidatus Sulfotelmatobacter sp. SbA7]